MIIGHEAICKRLFRAFERHAASHAFLFLGPEGVGKRLVALECAKRFLGDSPHAASLTLLSPEVVEEKGRVREVPIGVERVREAIRTITLSVSRGNRRVLIIDRADRLTESAQNALLKTLEEPYPETVIFLIAQEEGAILPTLRSRTERVSFSLVPNSRIRQFLPETPACFLATGRPGIAVLFRDNPEKYEREKNLLEQLLRFDSLSFQERAQLAQMLASDSLLAERLLSWWIGSLQSSVVSEDVLSRGFLLKRLESVSSTLRDMRRFPGSVRLTLETLFFFKRSASLLLARPFRRFT